jgi:hypothetical protein
VGQCPKEYEPQGAQGLGYHQKLLIPYARRKLDAEGVHNKLDKKVEHNKRPEACIGNVVPFEKDDEKQGRQIIDYGLNHIAQITGIAGVFIR